MWLLYHTEAIETLMIRGIALNFKQQIIKQIEGQLNLQKMSKVELCIFYMDIN